MKFYISFFLDLGVEKLVCLCSHLDYSCKVKHHAGIHTDIAGAKQEYWSSLAPLPLEVVLEAGQKAKDENSLREIFAKVNVYFLQPKPFKACFV